MQQCGLETRKREVENRVKRFIAGSITTLDEADLRLDKALSDVEELRIYAEQLESKHK